MRKPCARSATIDPIFPHPMIPSVLLVISTPMNRFFSHLPACVEASACGICRASASINVMACSAVVIELPNGVFITMMPLEVAVGMSTLSIPMPARPITLSRSPRSRIFGVTLVAERTARPSNLPITAASLSLSLPRSGWKSTSTPRSLNIWTAAGESASETRTRGAIVSPVNFIAADAAFCGFCSPRPQGEEGGESRRLGQRIPGLGEGPIQPLGQYLDVCCLDACAAPDAQSGRCIAIMRDIVAGAFLFDSACKRLGERRLGFCGKRRHGRIDNLQANRGVGAGRWIAGEEIH